MVDAQPELMAAVAKKAGVFGKALTLRVATAIAKEHPYYMAKKVDNSSGSPAALFKPPALPEGMTWV